MVGAVEEVEDENCQESLRETRGGDERGDIKCRDAEHIVAMKICFVEVIEKKVRSIYEVLWIVEGG